MAGHTRFAPSRAHERRELDGTKNLCDGAFISADRDITSNFRNPELESVKGRGAVFHFTLPRAE